MAITIVFGLLSSTILVLILIPSLIYIGVEIKHFISGSKSLEEVKQKSNKL